MLITSLLALFLSLITAALYWPAQSKDASLILSSTAGVSKFETGPNVLLLTAHPDDECMFFAPTIQALHALTPKVRVHSACLSVGDADGLGTIRRAELHNSLDVLGVDRKHRLVVDHADLQDNFTARWSPELIAEVLESYIVTKNISTILTFDALGISGHPNHQSLPEGAKHLLSRPGFPFHSQPKLFTLLTRPVLPKYSGVLGPVFSKLHIVLESAAPPLLKYAPSLGLHLHHINPHLTFVSGIQEYILALKAMGQHWSQLVWFRWLYVSFSRYMWVNEWVEVTF